MTDRLHLRVWTPGETLLDVADVRWVQAQLADGGGIGIRPGHAPLLAETVTAPLRYADQAGAQALDLEAGILQIERGRVTIFTSGLTQDPEISETSGALDRARFDRLARALLSTLRAQPGGVLDGEERE